MHHARDPASPPPSPPLSVQESVTQFGWSGSAALGGFLIEHYGFQLTFFVTASMQVTCSCVAAGKHLKGLLPQHAGMGLLLRHTPNSSAQEGCRYMQRVTPPISLGDVACTGCLLPADSPARSECMSLGGEMNVTCHA